MDFLQSLLGAPGSDQSQAMGLLASGMMGRGGFGQGLLAYNEYMSPEAKMQRQMGLLKVQEAQQRMEDQKRAREFLQNIPSPQMFASQQALAGGGGPTNANAANIKPVSPMSQLMHQGLQAGVVPFGDYLGSMQPKAPIKLSAGDTLLDADSLTPRYTAPKPEEKPAEVRAYEYARAQGYKGTYQQFVLEQKKAGANNVSLSVNTDKTLLNDGAGGLGKSITDARGNAQSALGTINTVNRLYDALDSGKVMAGPGTTFRQWGLQVGNMLGVAGKDGQEKLLNTRQTIQSLAQLELDAAQQMKGQGQITEAERSIIRRAASGDVDSMTVPELRLLGGVLDRTARWKIQSYNQQVKPLASMPNAAPIAPFLGVQEPSARTPAGVMRFDAQGNLITN